MSDMSVKVGALMSSVLQWIGVSAFSAFSAPVMLSHQCFSGSVSVLSVFQCSSDAESSVLQWIGVSAFSVSVLQWRWGHQCSSDISVGEVGVQ
jgi:hypothetical protein